MALPAPTALRRTLALALVTTGLLLATMAPASAHGIGGDAADRSVLGFVPLGIEHMLLGWDHLLFVAGVLLLARDPRRSAKLISVFVLGHSTTLIIATLAGWTVSAAVVDAVIGLSVVVVGALGMFAVTVDWARFTVLVGVFGLVHGLGLATRLHELGVPDDGLLWRVVAFNVGIEVGQLTAILLMVVFASFAGGLVKDVSPDGLRKVVSGGVFVGGMAATTWVALQALEPRPVVIEAETLDDAGCTLEQRTTPLPGLGGHVQQLFYGPDEATPLGAFGHSVGDGYVAILYPADLAADQVSLLQSFVDAQESNGVLAGTHPDDTDQVQAITTTQQLNCSSVDVEALSEFADTWFGG